MLKLLNGIKVLDLTRLLPGPLCTWYLAELGAHVTKIELPEGDYARFIPPLAKKNSYAFLQINFNKTIQTLNLKNKDELETFLAMVKEAHVVVESFRPGVTQKLGIDFESLKKINPSLVYCSISGYGQSGPYKDYPGHDINYLAYGGILSQMNGLSNFQIADLAGGSLSACTGILAALIDSQRTKTPHFIDISMLDCVMGLNQVALATYQRNHKDIPQNQDLLNGGFPFYSVYETKDERKLAVGCLEEKFWNNFCEVVNKPEWKSWHSQTPDHYPEIRNSLSAFFKTKTMREWETLLADKECCISPVLSLSESMEDQQVKARGVFSRRSNPEDGEFLTYQFPIKIK